MIKILSDGKFVGYWGIRCVSTFGLVVMSSDTHMFQNPTNLPPCYLYCIVLCAVLAIELLAACQAIEFLRPLMTTAPLEEVYKLVRSVVPLVLQ